MTAAKLSYLKGEQRFMAFSDRAGNGDGLKLHRKMGHKVGRAPAWLVRSLSGLSIAMAACFIFANSTVNAQAEAPVQSNQVSQPQDATNTPPSEPAPVTEPALDDTQKQTTPQTTPQTLTQRLASRLINPQLENHLRTAAATELIRLDTSAAVAIIRQGLANHGDPGTQRVIINALVGYPLPPRELSPILVAMFEKADASLIPEIAWALGRYDDHLLLRDLTALAQSDKTPTSVRQGAILTLGHHRTQAVAKLLMKLIESDEPEAVRQAAFESLGNLASEPELGSDQEAWREWWDINRRLTPARWDGQLLARFSQRSELLERQHRQAVARLVESQRQLLRATAHEQRPALLAAMLQDPLEPIRRLAVEQLDQRARAGELTDAILHEGLIERLDDVSPAIRLSSVKLLRNLRDESGSRQRTAAAVADRLTSLNETDQDVLRAYLLLLTDTPVRGAVDREIELLRNPALREDAAGAIVSAIDRQLVDNAWMTLLKTMLSQLVPDDQAPEPKLIELLGKVGGEKVWQRIAIWLKNPDERIRLAAARAWAQSERSLDGLATYAKDPALQPIIIDAAYRRGRSVATLMELIRHKPQQEQLAQSWQAALVAMAGRLSPEAIFQADAEFARLEETLALRAAFVGAAIARIDRKLADEPEAKMPATSVVVDLYLLNAKLLLSNGSADRAWGQINQLQKFDVTANPLTDSQQMGLDQLRLEILSAMGDLDRAMAQSDQILSRIASLHKPSQLIVLEPMASLFFNWASRAITTSQFEQAERILLYMRTHFQDVINTDSQTQMASMEAKIQLVRNPLATTQPATNPSTNPSTNPATKPSTSPAATAATTEPATKPASNPASTDSGKSGTATQDAGKTTTGSGASASQEKSGNSAASQTSTQSAVKNVPKSPAAASPDDSSSASVQPQAQTGP